MGALQFVFGNPKLIAKRKKSVKLKQESGKERENVAKKKHKKRVKNVIHHKNPVKKHHKKKKKNPARFFARAAAVQYKDEAGAIHTGQPGKKHYTKNFRTDNELLNLKAKMEKMKKIISSGEANAKLKAKAEAALKRAEKTLSDEKVKKAEALAELKALKAQGMGDSGAELYKSTFWKKGKGKGKGKGKKKGKGKRKGPKFGSPAWRKKYHLGKKKTFKGGKKVAKKQKKQKKHGKKMWPMMRKHSTKRFSLPGGFHLALKRYNPIDLGPDKVKGITGFDIKELGGLAFGGAIYGAVNGFLSKNTLTAKIYKSVTSVPGIGAAAQALPNLLIGAALHVLVPKQANNKALDKTFGALRHAGAGMVGAAVVAMAAKIAPQIPYINKYMSGEELGADVDFGADELGAEADFGSEADFGGVPSGMSGVSYYGADLEGVPAGMSGDMDGVAYYGADDAMVGDMDGVAYYGADDAMGSEADFSGVPAGMGEGQMG